jgi:tetratricopeptide (TPR) repeat protein
VRKMAFLVFFAFSLTVIACAPPSVVINQLVPGNAPEAPKLRRVAVLPFDGPRGKEVAAELEAALSNIMIDGKQYFEFVDRMSVDKVLKEMNLSMTGLVDAATAVKVGKMTGAQGIYTGVITASRASDNSYRENRTRCVRTVTKYDKNNKPYEACGEQESYSVTCTKREAVFAFTPKLINVERGTVVYASNFDGKAQSAACRDSAKPLADGQELIDQARKIAMDKIRKDIAPYYVQKKVRLMDSDEGASEPAAEKLKNGLDFAKQNRFDRACELWGEARRISPRAPAILYNLGVCQEAMGNYEEALALYTEADRQLGKPDKRITEALRSTKASIEKQKRLKEQMGR